MDQLCENDGPMRHNKVPDVPCLTHDRKCKRKLTDLNEAEKAGCDGPPCVLFSKLPGFNYIIVLNIRCILCVWQHL